MSEQISQLVDDELDEQELESVLSELRSGRGGEEWMMYHLIGDSLRRTAPLSQGFQARVAQALAAEPTVLAPRPRRRSPAYFAWAAAATITAVGLVGWIGWQDFGQGPAVVASKPATRSAEAGLAGSQSFQDYVMVHQEYSPTTAINGVRPYIRTVVSSTEVANH